VFVVLVCFVLFCVSIEFVPPLKHFVMALHLLPSGQKSKSRNCIEIRKRNKERDCAWERGGENERVKGIGRNGDCVCLCERENEIDR